MGSKTCPICGGSGYKSMSGVNPGSQGPKNSCIRCNGNGWVHEEESPHGGGGSSNGCFPRGTMIRTPTGAKCISAFMPGDLVCSMDARDSRTTEGVVLRVYRHRENRLWSLRLEGGTAIRTTAVHSFAIERGWCRASRLRPGHRIARLGGDGVVSYCQVVASGMANQIEEVFNLVVARHFNFVAEGALVHSFTHLRRARMLGWTLLGPCLGQSSSQSLTAGGTGELAPVPLAACWPTRTPLHQHTGGRAASGTG